MALYNPSFRSAAEIAVEFHTAVPDGLFRQRLSTLGITSISEMAAYTGVMNFGNEGLTDITGVEYATLLTALTVHTSDIDVAVDLSQLTSLSQIYMHNCSFPAVGSLRHHPVLSIVWIYNNQLDQTELERIILGLWENRVTIGALSCDIRLQSNPGSAAAAVSMAAKITDLETDGCTVII